MHTHTHSILLLFSYLLILPILSRAETSSNTPSADVVASISFSHLPRLSSDFLSSVLRSRTNHPLHPRLIHNDIVALMSLPQVADVVVTATPSARGIDLHYTIREAPIIFSLEATRDTPSRRIPRRFLRTLQPGLPFSPQTFFDAQRNLKEYFHAHHYHSLVVSGSVTYLPSTNLVRLILRVHEGPKQFLSKVTIHGNRLFSDSAIRNMLHCRERNRWLLRSGAFAPAQLERDRERILQAYLSRGYLDAHVQLTLRTLSRSNEVALLVNITEGPQYILGPITWHTRSVATNQLLFLQRNLAFNQPTPYTPDLPHSLAARIAQLSRAGGFPQPSCTIRALLAPNSSPLHPVVLLRISLAKQNGSAPPPHSLPAQPLMSVLSH